MSSRALIIDHQNAGDRAPDQIHSWRGRSHWLAKSDGSGAVFLINVTDPAEAHKLLEDLPLGWAEMMTFEPIPIGPLWPLGLMLAEPAK